MVPRFAQDQTPRPRQQTRAQQRRSQRISRYRGDGNQQQTKGRSIARYATGVGTFTAENIPPVLRAILDANSTHEAVATQSREFGHSMAASP